MILLEALKWGPWLWAKAGVDGTRGGHLARKTGPESADSAFVIFYLHAGRIVPQFPICIMGDLEGRVGHGNKICEAVCEAA